MDGDIADPAALARAGEGCERIVHLAAQAGVRHSIDNPAAYVRSNLVGHAEVLELARRNRVAHLVYASSSSVYGGSTTLPFSLADRVDTPRSLYAATKRADELLSASYAHLYRLPQTGLRFFTVYGPWGRPDMAVWLWTDAVLAGRPVELFNAGRMRRDFTFIDDIVAGVLAALDRPPGDDGKSPPHRVYNLGNSRSEPIGDVLALIERACGRQAERVLLPMQAGDVEATWADLSATTADLGWTPVTGIADGIPRFVNWYRAR